MKLGIGLYITQRLSAGQMQTIVWSTWKPQWQALIQTWNNYK